MKNDSQFLTTYAETEAWLKGMEIENYTINDDLTVDVDGHVSLYNKRLKHIPVQFGTISESFSCGNNQLTNLKGSPYIVGRNFWCSSNQLKNLEGCPKNIGGNFICDDNPLTEFSYFDFEVKGDIDFTPIEGIDYLEKYKEEDSYGFIHVHISFNEFKKIQALKKLENKLLNDLPINTNVTKKIKI